MKKWKELSLVVKKSIIVGVGCFVTILSLGVGLGVGLQSPSPVSGGLDKTINSTLSDGGITTENFNSSNTQANAVMNARVSDLKNGKITIDYDTDKESDFYKKQVETGVWCFHDEKPVLATTTTAQKKHDDFKANFPNLISTGTDIAINHDFKVIITIKEQTISILGQEATIPTQQSVLIYKCWDLGKPTP